MSQSIDLGNGDATDCTKLTAPHPLARVIYPDGTLSIPQTVDDVVLPYRFTEAPCRQLEKDPNLCSQNTLSRSIRCSLILGAPTILLGSLMLQDDADFKDLNRGAAILIVVMYTSYFMNLGYQIWPNVVTENGRAYLFKIQTVSGTVPGWSAMRIASAQLLYPYQPITSISSVSAIAGGQAKSMLGNLGPITYVGYIMLVGSNWLEENEHPLHLIVSDTFILIGCAGMLILGVFELDQFDRGVKIGHYIGVALMFCTFVGSIIQAVDLGGGMYLVSPLVLLTLTLVSFAYFSVTSLRSDQFQEEIKGKIEKGEAVKEEYHTDIRQRINRCSLLCIASEGMGLMLGVVTLAIYLWNWVDQKAAYN